jgi:hypothetical protein
MMPFRHTSCPLVMFFTLGSKWKCKIPFLLKWLRLNKEILILRDIFGKSALDVQKLKEKPEALTAGLDAVLRRKGIVLEALSREHRS